MNDPNRPGSRNKKSSARRVFAAGVTTLFAVISLVACGDDDESTVPVSEWVEQFDEICLELIREASSDPDLTPDEFGTLAAAAIAEARSIPPPDEMADVAVELLDALEFDSERDEVSQSEVEANDDRLRVAFTSLGISDECVRGDAG